MHIQWFPGHMHKAAKQVREALPEVDILIEVLDARIPFSSQNPMIAEIIGDKPCIKLLNKSDMADPEMTAIWQEYFEKNDNVRTIATNVKGSGQLRQITDLCHRMVPNKGRAGDHRVINAMIIGIPNVGKSTLINGLAGRTIAKTGNEPAVTKQQQRIKLEHGIILIDTPGMMWPKIDHENSGYRLAATGAIKETATDNTDVAFAVAEYLLEAYPERLVDRYKLESVPESEIELLEAIGRLRGSLRSGGSILLEKVSNILISELRSGFLGPITMEDPARVEKEQTEVVIAKEAKRIKDEARKKGFKKKRR
ncbi:ribosome biogenesis GTPase YlqF [Leucothrix arctica]|uniref:Ribosome biogenesis GTPase A n=1 Tax=Leucothrix arctica TaxID=1481894 RepID=A0A317CI90_9GAMM|nr:ribosome biogenesis GTPase YlqF [Leucothrix arctica]PWQ98275.1 ribosome biogenesis GTPase YlqF [Leucothrix arctica]